MKTITLSYSEAHEFVSENSHRGYSWDGWNITRWVPNPSAYMSKSGSFENGRWGMKFNFNLHEDGTWIVKVPSNV